MSNNFKIIGLCAVVVFISGCSNNKTPIELINEYEYSLAEQQMEDAIKSAEELSKTRLPEVNLITFYSEKVPPHFYDLHQKNGLDVSNVEVGYAPRPTLQNYDMEVDLPEGAIRTEVKLDTPTTESITHQH